MDAYSLQSDGRACNDSNVLCTLKRNVMLINAMEKR